MLPCSMHNRAVGIVQIPAALTSSHCCCQKSAGPAQPWLMAILQLLMAPTGSAMADAVLKGAVLKGAACHLGGLQVLV